MLFPWSPCEFGDYKTMCLVTFRSDFCVCVLAACGEGDPLRCGGSSSLLFSWYGQANTNPSDTVPVSPPLTYLANLLMEWSFESTFLIMFWVLMGFFSTPMVWDVVGWGVQLFSL